MQVMNYKNTTIMLLLAWIAFITPIVAQEKVDLEMMYRIKTEGIQKSQIQDLSFHLTDFIGPRGFRVRQTFETQGLGLRRNSRNGDFPMSRLMLGENLAAAGT
jgi:hypothetical protein